MDRPSYSCFCTSDTVRAYAAQQLAELLATITELEGRAENPILCTTYICSMILQFCELLYPLETQTASVKGWDLCLCVFKAAREKDKNKVQKQQHLCACEQEQQNCQVLSFLLMGQFKIHPPESILASDHQHCWQMVSFCYFKYLPESTPGFLAASLFYVMDQCNNC